jgi:hypothetical protein
VVSVGTDREVKTLRLWEMRCDVSRCKGSNKHHGSEHGSNPDPQLAPAPEMPLQRHVTHLTANDVPATILVT